MRWLREFINPKLKKIRLAKELKARQLLEFEEMVISEKLKNGRQDKNIKQS